MNRKRILTLLAMAAIALAGVGVVALSSHPAEMDYLCYWSSGHLLMQHADPYSRAGVLAIEKLAGYTDSRPNILRNPPWALFLTIPLARLGPMAGLLAWTLASVACILASLRLIRAPQSEYTLAFLFAPALAAICAGQCSPFLLLGFTLFLALREARPFAAGASLLLMALKPHLFLVFWAVLLMDCACRRRWRILAGLAAALAAASALATALDPQVWRQYLAMMRTSDIDREFLQTASTLFRLVVDRNAAWLLFVPSGLGIAWGCVYYLRNRQGWDWSRHGMLLMLVTVLVSPYGWFFDEIVLLPSIAFALLASERRRYATQFLLAVNSVLLVLLLVFRAPLTSGLYMWSPAAWLLWFLYARSGRRAHVALEAAPEIA